MDATNIFLTLKIEVNILHRQRRRLVDLFYFVDETPPQTDLFRAIEDFRRVLETAVRARLLRVTSGGTEEGLLRLVSQFLQLPELSLVDSIRADMMGAEVFGNDFMKSARSISKSPRGLSSEKLENLLSLGNPLLQRIPRTELLFGIQIPAILKNEVHSLPAYLICASWGCDIGSEAFVDCSFLWNWMRSDLLHLLKLRFRLQWLQDPNSVMEHGFKFNYFRNIGAQDLFGHTFFHVAVLVGTRIQKSDLFARGKESKFTYSKRSIMHYAAATGNEGVCQALEYRDMGLRDKDNRPPVFYAVKNGHSELTESLTTRTKGENP